MYCSSVIFIDSLTWEVGSHCTTYQKTYKLFQVLRHGRQSHRNFSWLQIKWRRFGNVTAAVRESFRDFRHFSVDITYPPGRYLLLNIYILPCTSKNNWLFCIFKIERISKSCTPNLIFWTLQKYILQQPLILNNFFCRNRITICWIVQWLN